jgi:ribulose-phosphate 3-epimerase
MIEVIPAILTSDTKELEEQIKAVQDRVSRVHIDIIDGEFVEGRTIEVEALASLEVDVLYDAHLMVREPTLWVEKCVRSLVDRITGQIEEMSDQFEFVTKVQAVGHEAGLALDLDTPIEKLDRDVLSYVDAVLLMGHKAGHQGGNLEPAVLQKVKDLQVLREEVGGQFKICVDGGVNKMNIKQIEDLGVEEVAVGSAIEDLLP